MNVQIKSKEHGGGLYDKKFYDWQSQESYLSGQTFAAHLAEVYTPKSVVDVGCGRGGWLKAFGELGAHRLVGFDGPWNSQEDMLDPRIEFRCNHLDEAVVDGLGDERFDLAMSLEVFEHLQPAVSADAVRAITGLSDVVMFGSAFTDQPGTNHINCRRHSFWGQLFRDRGYLVYDYFRPTMWGVSEIPFWYQQNTFLYVKEGHALNSRLIQNGYAQLKRLELLDFVHPYLLGHHTAKTSGMMFKAEMKERLKAILPAPVTKAIIKLKHKLAS